MFRYAYHRSSWLVAGRADPAPTSRLYTHPDTPITAEQLSKQVKKKLRKRKSDNLDLSYNMDESLATKLVKLF